VGCGFDGFRGAAVAFEGVVGAFVAADDRVAAGEEALDAEAADLSLGELLQAADRVSAPMPPLV